MPPKRQPSGTPTGGQYAAGDHPEPDTVLDPGPVPTRTGDNNNFEWRLPNGKLHRIGGPAVQTDGGISAGGYEGWYQEGGRHRTDGPAEQWGGGLAAGGSEEWRIEGRLHRTDGPAVQRRGGVAAAAHGHELWFKEGRLHRTDGPAVQYDGGTEAGGTEEYWLEGTQMPADQAKAKGLCRNIPVG